MENVPTRSLGSSPWGVLGVCLALVLMVWFVFGQSLSFDFVNYDDPQYVYENPYVSEGLTLEGLRWIITHPHSFNWHPLTSFSHMLDCQLYGLNPAGHHLGNIVLHTATAIFLFLMLRLMTGSLWRSAVVAALFSIHPLRVESVVWISERKDVLSGLFFMLTLWAYARYARRAFSFGGYLLVLGLFMLGLLSKPMLVTLPCVLLLLDFWPLKRFGRSGVEEEYGGEEEIAGKSTKGRKKEPQQPSTINHQLYFFVLEKIPLFILSAIFCGITVWAQQDAVTSVDSFPISWRVGNALLSYMIYLRQMVFPAGLSVLYPAHAETLSLWRVGLSSFLLLGITLAVVRQRKTRPYLLTGWFWYLGMLIPVIGILQVGGQAHADRYTYLPQIGLLVAGCWLVGDWVNSSRRRIAASFLLGIVLLSLMVGARTQALYWRDGRSLWTRSLALTKNNFVAHSNLGTMLFVDGDTTGAIEQFEKSVQMEPHRSEVWNNLAVAYADQERWVDAVGAAQQASALAETQCSPEIIELIRSRLAGYLIHLQSKDDDPPTEK